jgi:hypothetical protein
MERDKELYERQIKIVDAQIDNLVYDLYGLTEEEVRIVEGSGMMELKMNERDLYPAIEKILTRNKNCLPEYVGTELSLKEERENQPQSRCVLNVKRR